MAIIIRNTIQRKTGVEGFLASFALASERPLACRLPSLLTAVVELELSAVTDWRRMPLTFTLVALLRGSDFLVWFLSTQGLEPLMSLGRTRRDESLPSDTCGKGIDVMMMLSI